MKILLIFLCILCINAYEMIWENLNNAQREVAFRIYNVAKPLGLEMTMIAIAWQESRLGETPLNLQDPSCGAHHIQITNFLRLSGLKDTPLTRNIYCNNLIKDVELSTITAIEIFKTFRVFHKGAYDSAIKSYNGGYNFASSEAKRYATDKYYRQVYRNVKYLEALRHSVFEKSRQEKR